MEKKKVIIVCGPTGAGKTETALALAKEFDGELVNADSQQVYKYIPILTNTGDLNPKSENRNTKQTQKFKSGIRNSKQIRNPKFQNTNSLPITHSSELKGIPIHLIQFLDPWERFNVFEWRKLALEKVENILSRGKLPILVGGTGLYIDSIVNNYELQITNDEIDWERRRELESHTVKELCNLLDNETLNNLNNSDKNNKRRLIRLIEKRGKTSPQPSPESRGGDISYEYLMLYPEFDWDELKQKLEMRVEAMIKEGAVKEVLDLIDICKKEKSDLETTLENFPIFGTMGVKQIFNFVKSDQEKIDETIELIKIVHRQYAKRQRTWFEGKGRGYDLNRFSDVKDAISLVEPIL